MSLNKWMDKLWFIHIMEYYFMITRNELLSHKKTWRTGNAYYKVEEVSIKRLLTVWFQLHTIPEKAKLKTIKRLIIARGLRRGREEWIGDSQGIFKAWRRESICNGGHMTICICQNTKGCLTQRVNPNVNQKTSVNSSVSLLVHQLQQMHHTKARCK